MKAKMAYTGAIAGAAIVGAILLAGVTSAAGPAYVATTHPKIHNHIRTTGELSRILKGRVETHSSTTVFGHGDTTITPAPAGTSVPVSAESALAAYYAHAPMGPGGAPTSVVLAEMSTKSGPVQMTNRLVWVVEFSNAPVELYGPPSTSLGNQGPTLGTWLGVTDANTGQYLLTENYFVPRSTS